MSTDQKRCHLRSQHRAPKSSALVAELGGQVGMSVSLRGAGAMTTRWCRRSSYMYNHWGRRSSTAHLFTRNNLYFDRAQTCNNISEREPRKHQDLVIPSSGQGRSGNSLCRGGHTGFVWGTWGGVWSPQKQSHMPIRAPGTTALSGLNLPHQGANHSRCERAK